MEKENCSELEPHDKVGEISVMARPYMYQCQCQLVNAKINNIKSYFLFSSSSESPMFLSCINNVELLIFHVQSYQFLLDGGHTLSVDEDDAV